MAKSIQSAVLHAAEAALAQMVMTTKMADSKLISEGVMYETIHHTLRSRTGEWVNHEHKVKLNRTVGSPKGPGDDKRADFGVKLNDEVTLVEVKVALRATLKKTVDVTRDMQKLVDSVPYHSRGTIIAKSSYLIVFNIATYDTHGDDCGVIQWLGKPRESAVKCIGRFVYTSKRFVRTAAVFKITR
jgi:hypothetical protein